MNVDASNIIPCNYLICDNCSQQLFPVTQLENDDFAQTLTVTNQEIKPGSHLRHNNIMT